MPCNTTINLIALLVTTHKNKQLPPFNPRGCQRGPLPAARRTHNQILRAAPDKQCCSPPLLNKMSGRGIPSPCRGGYRGVTYDHRCRRWRARLYCLGEHLALGRFPDAAQAAEIHDIAACFVYKDAAITNFGMHAAQERLRQSRLSGLSKQVTDRLRIMVLKVAQHARKANVGDGSMHALRKQAALQAGLRAGHIDGDQKGNEEEEEEAENDQVKQAGAVDHETKKGHDGSQSGEALVRAKRAGVAIIVRAAISINPLLGADDVKSV
jgi:hypothetical protein